MTDIGTETDIAFGAELKERDEALDREIAALGDKMEAGEDRVRQRLKNPRGQTTSLAVREAALKRRILETMDELVTLTTALSNRLAILHVDETELAFVVEGRNQSAIEYWKRLADGPIYAGVRGMLDILYNRHRIDATALAALSDGEIRQVASLIQSLSRR